jgi:2-dehydropantoate 2-reductase
MRIGVMGAGAIGGYLAARLATAGEEVALVARGAHLAAIREQGLRLRSELGDAHCRPALATDRPAEIGPVDLLLFNVKLYDAATALEAAGPMIGPATCAATFQNGLAGAELLAQALGSERTIGGTAMIPVQLETPGVVRHPARIARFVIGSLAGAPNEAVRALAAAFAGAGVEVAVSERIEVDLWQKLVLLASFSGVSAVTRGSFATIRAHTATRAMLHDAVHEAIAVARAQGVDLAADCEARTMHFLLEIGAPEVKASLTHDLETGRRLELPWLSGALVQLGEELGVPTPTHRFICAALAPYVNGPPVRPKAAVTDELRSCPRPRSGAGSRDGPAPRRVRDSTMAIEDEVRAVSERFYQALNGVVNGDAGPMESIWLQGAEATTMHPIGGREVGWPEVWHAWQQVAAIASGGKVALQNQLIWVAGDVGYEVGLEDVDMTLGGQRVQTQVRVTNIYRRDGAGWRIVHHHVDASRAEMGA